jgi:hypothetical protein
MLVLFRLKIVLILSQDRCMVCNKCTIGSEIMLDAADGTPRWLKWMLVSFRLEIVLILTKDRRSLCAECTMGSEIVLDAPDVTTR